MTDPIELRQWVRITLSAFPEGRRGSKTLLFTRLKKEFPELRVDELTVAIDWNQAKGYVDFIHNGDEERDEFFLTDRGRMKEGLA